MIDEATQKVIDLLCELVEVTPQDVVYALGAYEAAKRANLPPRRVHSCFVPGCTTCGNPEAPDEEMESDDA